MKEKKYQNVLPVVVARGGVGVVTHGVRGSRPLLLHVSPAHHLCPEAHADTLPQNLVLVPDPTLGVLKRNTHIQSLKFLIDLLFFRVKIHDDSLRPTDYKKKKKCSDPHNCPKTLEKSKFTAFNFFYQ